MSGAGTVVEIAYGEGWDLAARALLGPLTVEAARARDAAGLPYAAVCRTAGGGGPAEVRLVAWREHYAGVWVYDDQGRRTRHIEMRLDGDRLFRRRADSWLYPGPDMPEFDQACPRATVRLLPDGRGSRDWRPAGEQGPMPTTTAEPRRTSTRPAATRRTCTPSPGAACGRSSPWRRPSTPSRSWRSCSTSTGASGALTSTRG
ncbi:hypothetical protein GCM10010346_55890 [Streptomyces chryseus]|uniref:Uncharacterized protein n=1 Tax=Streptomyces chryseus TaxID=68186 RepID=A0ABQ3E3X5_9ACTN|nr:hypothetical protein GCM10010346_55890 [Streptomyces chryseus]